MTEDTPKNNNDKDQQPGPLKRSKDLEDLTLSLKNLAGLMDIGKAAGEKDGLIIRLPLKWDGYFQSPVNKAAWTLGKSIRFKSNGSLENPTEAYVEIVKWLGLKGKEIKQLETGLRNWLENGEPDRALFDRIKKKLNENTLKNSDLYDHLICRLVREDQLRYDPDYHAIYQLTPGQMRLLGPPAKNTSGNTAEEGNDMKRTELKKVQRNQKAYWGISETFQSLIAMFDSDLGSNKPVEKDDDKVRLGFKKSDKVTKHFIGIRPASGEKDFLSPKELNMFSPLRYWAPPPAFAQCVFHMIFWRSIITGKDLYKRDVVNAREKSRFFTEKILKGLNSDKIELEEKDLLKKLTKDTYIKEMFAEPVKQFLKGGKRQPGLVTKTIVSELCRLDSETKGAGNNNNKENKQNNEDNERINKFLNEILPKGNQYDYEIELRADTYYVIVNWFNPANYRTTLYDRLFDDLASIASKLARYRKGGKVIFSDKQGTYEGFYPGFIKPTHFFSRNERQEIFIPAEMISGKTKWEPGRPYDEEKTTVKKMRKFLRDKIIELILWSHYQMEIRSVGEIPVQNLYEVTLTPKGLTALRKLKDAFDTKIKNSPNEEVEESGKINDAISEAISTGKISEWVELKKVYGGKHRQIYDAKLIDRIKWLEKSPA